MSELYEEHYGVASHHDPNKPLSTVAFHPSEEFIENSDYELYVKKFSYLKVYEKTGLSLNEFLQLPRYKINTIFRALSQATKDDLDEVNNSVLALEKIAKGK